jgi:flagellar operon protein
MNSSLIPSYLPQKPVTANVTAQKPGSQQQGTPSFADMLQNEQAKSSPDVQLHVSAHAENRMREHGVQMTEKDWQTVGEAVKKAEQKGSKDTYVMYGNAGFVVNVKNHTVVTTMVDRDAPVVTNVDSVVVVPRLDR